MGIGYCKFCRKHKVRVTQFDRHPDRTIIWNKQGESQGICYDCELQIKSTKAELLEALDLIGYDSIHMYIVIRELLPLLDDVSEYNQKDIFHEVNKRRSLGVLSGTGYRADNNTYASLKEHVGAIVVAASRMKQESTPIERKQAVHSIFRKRVQCMEDYSDYQKRLEREYGKWLDKI
jgi:ribosomal protein L34E